MGPNQTYKLLHSKENNEQNEKTTTKMGENICKYLHNFRNIWTAHTLNIKTKKHILIKKLIDLTRHISRKGP